MKNPSYFKSVVILARKELAGYFHSPIAYIFLAVFLIVSNWLFFSNFFLVGQASLRSYFSLLPWIFLFLAPSLTMRQWAEEKRSGTIEFLLTLPLTYGQVVLAKFLSSFIFLLIAMGFSLSLPFSVAYLGQFDYGAVVGGYLGAIFLGALYLALGLWLSSLTRNQIVAFIMTLALGYGITVISFDFVLLRLPTAVVGIVNYLGSYNHYNNLAKGVVDSRDIIYYVSLIFLFLWLNVKVLERRK